MGGHKDVINHIDWSFDSKYILTGGEDFHVRLYNLDDADLATNCESDSESKHGFEPQVFADQRHPIKGCFFAQDKQHVFIITKDGVVATWRFDAEGEDIFLEEGSWTCAGKSFMNVPGGHKITECAFNPKTNMLLAGTTGGVFALYELLPTVSNMHTLSIGDLPIESVALSPTGEWIAVGSSGQLLVWEWQSETYILKQQGHSWGVNCCAFAPSSIDMGSRSLASAEGQGHGQGFQQSIMATGGYDGKVKLWNTISGFCFVTFSEHTAQINDVIFTPQANAVVSCSADGSIRAYDLLRYRNFRTFIAPGEACGFEKIAMDSRGEIIAGAVAGDSYAVHVYSIQTGKLLDTICGNEAPVSSLKFSPSIHYSGTFLTGSWDGMLTTWDLYSKDKTGEKLNCGASVIDVAFDPRGNNMVACSQLAGQVMFWDIEEAAVKGTIDGIRDIKSGRVHGEETAAVSKHKKKSQKYNFGIEFVNLNQHFSSITYNTSGNLLLCTSRNSPHVCLYGTDSKNLLYRYTLTANNSLSGIKILLNSGKTIIEGENLALLDVSDSEEEDFKRKKRRVDAKHTLPGVKVGETAKAYSKKEFHLHDCNFSADGKNFGVATSHGLYMYKLDLGAEDVTYGTALERFTPTLLTKEVLKALEEEDLCKAMILALALNDAKLLIHVYEKIPLSSIPNVVSSLSQSLLPPLIHFLAAVLHPTLGTKHIQVHVVWVEHLLDSHMNTFLQWCNGSQSRNLVDPISTNVSTSEVQALLIQTLQQIETQHKNLGKVFQKNLYTMLYLNTAGESERKAPESV